MGVLKTLKILTNLRISTLFILGFLFLTFFSFFPSFSIDQNDWRIWSQRLVELGPTNFYTKDYFTDYFPGFLYIIWFIGIVKNIFFVNVPFQSLSYDLLLKLPANLAQLFTAFLIYKIVKKEAGVFLGKIGFLLYIFNPALIFSTSIWGQFDTISTLFILLSLKALIEKHPELATILYALSFSMKPQAIAFSPIIALFYFLNYKPIRWISLILIFLMTTLLIYFPFFPNNPVGGIVNIVYTLTNFFNCTTCFAFNFWGIFGNWQNDLEEFLSFKKEYWGIFLFILSLVIIFYKKLRLKFSGHIIYLVTSLATFAFFITLTRMHERYLFPFFPFFLIAALLLKSRVLISFYLFISLLHLINLYIPYVYYNNNMTYPSMISNVLQSNFKLLSFISTLCFIILIMVFIRYVKKIP